MNESRAITGLDRLPWLADEGDSPRRRKTRARPLGIALLMLATAAISYWLGTQSWTLFSDSPEAVQAPAETIPLPEPVLAEPEILTEPEVESPPPPPVAQPAQRIPRATAPARRTAPAKPKAVGRDEAKAKETRSNQPWPVRKVEGSAGRLVHVGTFASRRQAKRGWNALMRVNPALQRLPAMVVPVQSKRDSKVYYRLQMGTTSQAHSVVLCQRMRMIGQSCIVLSDPLDGKAQ
jgi:hypothetical protein